MAEGKKGVSSGEFVAQMWVQALDAMEPRKGRVPAFNTEYEAQLFELVKQIVSHLFLLDEQLADCGEALRILQPASNGRLDISFWNDHSSLPGKHPTMHMWKVMPKGWRMAKRGEKLTPLDISSRPSNKRVTRCVRLPAGSLAQRAQRRGLFKETREDVQGVLRQMDALLKARKTILEEVRRLKIGFGQASKNQRALLAEVGRYMDAHRPQWEAEAAARIAAFHDEKAAREFAHLVLLEDDEELKSRRGYQFEKPQEPGKA